MLSDIMQMLAKEMGLEGNFATELPGHYSIPLEEDTVIEVKETDGGCVLTCLICPTPTKKQEGFFQQALLGDLFGQGTMGNILGLTDDAKKLILWREFTYLPDFKEFRNSVEDFANAVDFWREQASLVEQSL